MRFSGIVALKSREQCFSVARLFIMIHNGVLPFKSVDEILKSKHVFNYSVVLFVML